MKERKLENPYLICFTNNLINLESEKFNSIKLNEFFPVNHFSFEFRVDEENKDFKYAIIITFSELEKFIYSYEDQIITILGEYNLSDQAIVIMPKEEYRKILFFDGIEILASQNFITYESDDINQGIEIFLTLMEVNPKSTTLEIIARRASVELFMSEKCFSFQKYTDSKLETLEKIIDQIFIKKDHNIIIDTSFMKNLKKLFNDLIAEVEPNQTLRDTLENLENEIITITSSYQESFSWSNYIGKMLFEPWTTKIDNKNQTPSNFLR